MEFIPFTQHELITTCYALHQTIDRLVYHALDEEKQFRNLVDLESFKLELQALTSVHGRTLTAISGTEEPEHILVIPPRVMDEVMKLLTAPTWESVDYHPFGKHKTCAVCKIADKEGKK